MNKFQIFGCMFHGTDEIVLIIFVQEQLGCSKIIAVCHSMAIIGKHITGCYRELEFFL
ncbi:hypothetical protein EVA_01212 [gut metagenome]|uniref:Uncharacterized protein n=1 Tax=gut metagenome TaxID=749906 RepID=J9H804_9ZZZZ